MISPQLDGRVKDFLSTLRVGVDFGEAAGGIALVHGNTILHAETFVEFHDATLEDRRNLRRGRRSRHAKKMRLARLRSWVLRQRMPNGMRLPDPYAIMHDRRYQTKPQLFMKKGVSPLEYPTWVDAAKEGEVDADGFVCALTHLFQKRGYKYDDKELGEFSDKKLEDLLNSCCMLSAAADLSENLKGLIGDDGKPRLSRPKLKAAYEAALTRKPMPRKAVPRQMKEADLREMVRAFGKRMGLPDEQIAKWQKELVGLINRTLREARFDNRVRSGCTWCGKNAPRVKNDEVRHLAYLAAIRNLRIDAGVYGQTRPLDDNERGLFTAWWDKRLSGDKFKRGAKASVFDRAPNKDNIEKAFGQLNVAKAWIRDRHGKPYRGYSMLNQIVNLLGRKPGSGRAKLCMEHLKMASEGKTMKDAGVEWQTMRAKHAPNPKREQHDARVLKRIEQLLFYKDKTGDAAWRWRDASGVPLPLGFITLEVPKPEDSERLRKGQQAEAQTKSLKERLYDETEGECIYQHSAGCRALGGKLQPDPKTFEKDHIVPQSKFGPDVRVNLVACCRECNHPNTGKGDRLPSEWIRYGSADWLNFEKRIKGMKKLPDAKKALLLLPPGSGFPDDPTPLAQVGARPRAFIAELEKVFKKHEVPAPTVEYRTGITHVQRIEGSWTTQLRNAWLWKDKEAKVPNFPEKDRSDMFNHAQDAALIAATPPHTWRVQAQEPLVRYCAKHEADGRLVFENGKPARELRMRPGMPLLALAPDWAEFMSRRRVPVVIALGKMEIGWKSRMMDQSLYAKPGTLDGPLWIHKPLEEGERPAHPGQRRKLVKTQKGGLVVQVRTDNAVRKVQVKPASTAVIFWHNEKGRLQISLERPMALRRFVNVAIDPPIPKGAHVSGRWRRGEMIRLDAKGKYPAGFYRVKELSDGGVIALPENNVTAEIAKKLGLPEDVVKVTERKLGKTELGKLFPL